MPTRIPPSVRPIPPPSTTTASAPGATPATAAAKASDPASAAPVDASATSNSFESGTRGDFVANHGAGTPAGATSLLNARLQNLTDAAAAPKPEPGAAALERMAALVPPASELSRGAGEKLVNLVKTQLSKARAEGKDHATLDTSDLDKLLVPAWTSGHLGYDAVAKALGERGYETFADGFMGVSIELPKDAIPTVTPDEFFAELATKISAAPSGADKTDALAELVVRKLDAARAAGETSFTLETGELDRALGDGGPSYDQIAKKLEALGYQTFADGFMGVDAGWQEAASSAPTQAEMLDALSGLSPTKEGSAADQVASLLDRKLAEAAAAGETSVTLEPSDLDSLLKPIFGSAHSGYQPLAEALEKRGYQTFADGFMGVSAGWDE